MTRDCVNAKGEGMVLTGRKKLSVYRAQVWPLCMRALKCVSLNAERNENGNSLRTSLNTTVEMRAILPMDDRAERSAFLHRQRALGRKRLQMLNTCYRILGLKPTVILRTGRCTPALLMQRVQVRPLVVMTWYPGEKHEIISRRKLKLRGSRSGSSLVAVTAGERYNKVIDIWAAANDRVSKAMMRITCKPETVINRDGGKSSRSPSTST